MMDFSEWPAWGRPLVWTLVTRAVCWAIGRVFASILMSKVPRWLQAVT